jgi:quercetin dioxygenase-like cupin family protein
VGKGTSYKKNLKTLDLSQGLRGGPAASLRMQPLINGEREQVLSLLDETKFAPNGIVSRTLLQTANGRAVLFGFDAGQELSEHTSTQHALVHILSGECDFTLGKEVRRVKSGDLIYMPPNLPHALLAITQFSMLLVLFKPEVKGGAIPSLKPI